MPAALVTKIAKTADATPAAFPLGFLDRAGDGLSLAGLQALVSAAGALINPATAEGVEAVRALLAGNLAVNLPTGAATDAKVEAVRALLAAALTVNLPTGAASSALQTTGNTTLASILTTLQAQRVETIWTDDTGTRFLRVDIGGTIVWTTVAGTASGPPGAGARPDSDSGSVVSRTSYAVTAGGTGYAIGDFLDHIVVTDGDAGDLVSNFWINVTAGTRITAPSAANITPMSALPTGAATDAKVEAVRALLAGILTVRPAGSIPLGYRPITGLTAAVGLGTIPTGAKYALIAVSGAGARYRDDGTDPTATVGQPISDGDTFEYDGTLSAFKIIQTAPTAVLDVTFYG